MHFGTASSSLGYLARQARAFWPHSQRSPDVGSRRLAVPVKLIRPLAPLARQLGGRLGGGLRSIQLSAQLAHLDGKQCGQAAQCFSPRWHTNVSRSASALLAQCS